MQIPTDLTKEEQVTYVASRSIEESMAVIGKAPPVDLVEVLDEYILESIHGGWEGYNPSEVVAIAAFLKDLATFGTTAGRF
jgi:hypothetical protein